MLNQLIMKKTLTLLTGVLFMTSCTAETLTLKDAFKDKFLIGVAVNQWQCSGEDYRGAETAKKHFNSIVAENVMKCEAIHPEENTYFWDDADRFVEFGEQNNMFIVGHCLLWHSQLAPWFCKDSVGNLVEPQTLRDRIRDHIYTIVSRYKGRIHGWDVVNEAIEDNGDYRNSDFYKILGEEFIPLAFQYAHEADPDAELYINDYSMNNIGKRDRYVKIVNEMKSKGIRIDAIGMQSHMGLDYPNLTDYENSIKAFASTGCKVMITELDMGALPSVNRGANISDTVAYQRELNPYPDKLPANVSEQWNNRMDELMTIYLRHADVISRVTAWGVSDGDSWRNDWPVRGRREYPLLFDRNYNMKPFLHKYLNDK